jgi:hypothetical protein
MLCQTLQQIQFGDSYVPRGTLITVNDDDEARRCVSEGYIRILTIEDILRVNHAIVWPPAFSGNKDDDIAYTLGKLEEAYGGLDGLLSR